MATLLNAGSAEKFATAEFIQRVESLRLEATSQLDPSQRGALGQYFTPFPVASVLASL